LKSVSLGNAPPAFRDELRLTTLRDRDYLLQAPVIVGALAGQISRARYVAFLTQAWHHVRHTVPLLMAVGANLPDRHGKLRNDLIHYLNEEAGHDDWILNDIQAAGGDRRAAAASLPNIATDAMVAYAWATVQRRNPIGFFGMVYVLEGTSVSLAVRAADEIEKSLGLPKAAFTYLRSHGTLDLEHIEHLGGILDGLTDPADQAAVIQCARAMFWLYGNVFRSLEKENQ